MINKKQKIDSICRKYNDAELKYHEKNCKFHYGMDEKYNNEILITFPLDSIQIIQFKQELNHLEDNGFIFYMISWGMESRKKCDRVWIWWNEVK